MLTQDQGFHLSGRRRQLLSDQGPETDRIKLGAQSHHALGRQVEPLGRQVRQDVDRIRNDQDGGIFFVPGAMNALQDSEKQFDVAVDQVEPALVRLAPEAGRDANQIVGGTLLRAARGDHLIGHQAGAV